MTRRQLLASLPAAAAAAPNKWNVLLILTDDHGAHLGALGTPGLRTPRIDQLAREGVLFSNAFAATASCAPSRCSILTGAYPHSNGVWRNVLLGMIPVPPAARDVVGVHRDVPTLVEILNQAGYVTGITAKYHLNPPSKFDFQHKIPIPKQRPESYRAAVGKFIQDAGGRPFFLMANTTFPHRPFRSHLFPTDVAPVNPDETQPPPSIPDLPGVRQDWADYLTSIQCADAITGAILDALRESGQERNTLVLFAGDQGPAYVRGKATMYDLGIRVPLIVKGPGIAAARDTKNLVSLIDLAPTVLDYLGIDIPSTVQGASLRPLLEAKSGAPWRSLIFAEHNSHGLKEIYPVRSVYDGRFHYLRNLMPEREYAFIADARDAGPQWDNNAFEPTLAAKEQFPIQYELLQATIRRPPEELYDRVSDPHEMHNIAADPRFAAALGRLREAMNQWMRQTNDPGDPEKITWRQ